MMKYANGWKLNTASTELLILSGGTLKDTMLGCLMEEMEGCYVMQLQRKSTRQKDQGRL